jgi:hypothetical protein
MGIRISATSIDVGWLDQSDGKEIQTFAETASDVSVTGSTIADPGSATEGMSLHTDTISDSRRVDSSRKTGQIDAYYVHHPSPGCARTSDRSRTPLEEGSKPPNSVCTHYDHPPASNASRNACFRSIGSAGSCWSGWTLLPSSASQPVADEKCAVTRDLDLHSTGRTVETRRFHGDHGSDSGRTWRTLGSWQPVGSVAHEEHEIVRIVRRTICVSVESAPDHGDLDSPVGTVGSGGLYHDHDSVAEIGRVTVGTRCLLSVGGTRHQHPC